MPRTDLSARIILEDGTEFEGEAFGHDSSSAGEVMVYTGQTDLPRLLTDPTLRGALLVLSDPVAGITGIPDETTDILGLGAVSESDEVQVAGLIVSSRCDESGHYSSKKDLAKWLKRQQVPAVSGIDTRALIQRLNLRGSLRGKILVSGTKDVSFSAARVNDQSVNVSVKRSISYGSGEKKIVLVDCGVRNSVIRALVTGDTTVVRVPCNHDYSKEAFDGVVVAGGPGDPTSCEKTVAVLKEALKAGKPVFAVGQGAVILGIAAGASAYRMARGHRSRCVPCIDLESGRCYMTAQNHGYGIRDDSLPEGWYPTFLDNAENSIEGFAGHKGLYGGVLFQPEGNPGPRDADYLYEDFIRKVLNGGIPA